MRIALNAHLLAGGAGYRSAGIHGYISQLLRQLPGGAPEHWRFEALVGAATTLSIPGMRLRRARIDTRPPLARIFWEQALQPLQLRAYDLYHAMAFVAPIAMTAPMVVTVYDLSFLRFPGRLSAARRLYLRALTALTCARARRIIAISQSTADDLTRLLGAPAENIDVTPLGYDKAAFWRRRSPEIEHFRQKQGLPPRFWLYIGTLEPRKNLALLLRAYAQLKPAERLPLILGGGLGWRGQETLHAIDRLKLGDSARHIGFVPAADLPLWYNCAEAFLYPSLYEGFGLPLLEAMACGAPVLTSDASSLPEVLGGAGKCLPPADSAAWSGALAALKRDRDWREAARERGLERAKRFSWARTAELTLLSYRAAIEKRAAPAREKEAAARWEAK